MHDYVKNARRNRVTHSVIEVHDTTHVAYPKSARANGKWRVVCTSHDRASPSTSNLAEANRYASSPWGWCPQCRELNPDGVVKGQKHTPRGGR